MNYLHHRFDKSEDYFRTIDYYMQADVPVYPGAGQNINWNDIIIYNYFPAFGNKIKFATQNDE